MLVPVGTPGGHLSKLKKTRHAWAPAKPPRGQTLRSPRPKVTSVLTANLGTKIMDFRWFFKQNLNLKGWDSQVHRESPGKFEQG